MRVLLLEGSKKNFDQISVTSLIVCNSVEKKLWKSDLGDRVVHDITNVRQNFGVARHCV